jgi:FAD dependent oxidoreductase TIGR03364
VSSTLDSVDVVVVGAGIVGLAHAFEAVERGLTVAVVERDDRAVGASVRNFGHACATGLDGDGHRYGLAARSRWLRLAEEAGFWAKRTGTVMVARAEDELAVLREFAELRGADQARLLTPAEVAEYVPTGAGVLGGALFPEDLRVEQRAAVGAIARYLAGRGVRFHWATAAHGVDTGVVRTSRGEVHAGTVILATGHDVDRHFPELAAEAQVKRCVLRMLRVANPFGDRIIEPAVQTGFSLLRYGGFGECPSLETVRERLTREQSELIGIGLNLMFTQLPDGTLTIGDTHAYDTTHDPFDDRRLEDSVLGATAELLGVERLDVVERWRGVYAAGTEPFMIAEPVKGVHVVAVTSGVGMTTALGLGAEVLAGILG